MSPLRRILAAAAFAGIAPLPARAMDYQVHGFAAQAYLLSEGNNFFGDSTNGSYDFYEAGLSGTVNLGHGLLASAQVLIRDAGATDTGKPRLDFALVDWNAIQGVQTSAGIRVGRVKNPLGLYNDTRDVVFARPSLLMPQSVYFDGFGLRSLLFSSDGVQLYANRSFGAHDWSLNLTGAKNRDLSDKETEVLTYGGPQPEDVRIKDLYFSQLVDSWDGGRLSFALSHVHARIGLEAEPSFPVDTSGRFNFYVLSARYNAERYSLTSEYRYVRSEIRTRFQGQPLGESKSSSDGGYVQADFRATPRWTLYARYDASFNDADDRDGSKGATSNEDRYSEFAHDLTVGSGFRFDEHWGLWAEVHRIYGTATAPPIDNPDGADDERWTLMTIMAGYRF